MLIDISFVKEKLEWIQEEKIWPHGIRYLWTDAFGVVLLGSMYRHTEEDTISTRPGKDIRWVAVSRQALGPSGEGE